jgi:hypothetical protein
MTFQFQCPQGHLLQGEETQAGQHCNCPMCGMLFIIPQPIAAPQPNSPPAFGDQQPPSPPTPPAPVPEEPKLLHIPCPNGHELEVPPDMLEQDVLCPQCKTQFTLREKDSVEYKRHQEQEEERRAKRIEQFWLKLSIGMAIVVVLGLIIMFAMRGR